MSDATEIAKPRASVFAGLRLTWTAAIAGSVLLFWLILALFGPWIAPHGEAEIISGTTFAPIGEGGLLGTDKLGRDVFSRLIYGVRTTLLLALITTVISFAFGVTLGFAAAILKGWFDIVESRIVEAFMAFPSTLLALVASLFVLDLAIPDPFPFVDEIVLGVVTILIARWQSRRKESPPTPKPPPKDVTPP